MVEIEQYRKIKILMFDGDLTDGWVQMWGDEFTYRVEVNTVEFGVII